MAKKKFLIAQKEGVFVIRTAFQKALAKVGFVEDITGERRIEVEEKNRETNEIIQSISISDLEHEEIKQVWCINLEHEIVGISTKNYFKTPEVALLVLTHKEGYNTSALHIILVELKSTLQDSRLKKNKRISSTLEDCEKKLQAAMNRLYMLLSINEHRNDTDYRYQTIIVKFKAIICYKEDKTKKDDNCDLFKILKNENTNLLTCETILDANDKIEVTFFEKQQNILISEIIKSLGK